MGTLPSGFLGFIEFTITNAKPSEFRIIDLNTLILSVVPTYHPETTETITVHYKDMKKISSSVVDHIEMYKDSLHNNTLCIVQPALNLASRVFPPSPYSKENLQLLNRFCFQDSDLNDSEYTQFCKFLGKNKHGYARQHNDVGKVSIPIRIRLKPDAKLQTLKPTKVPIRYRDQLNNVLDDIQKNGITKQIGSTLPEKPNSGTTFLNPMIII